MHRPAKSAIVILVLFLVFLTLLLGLGIPFLRSTRSSTSVSQERSMPDLLDTNAQRKLDDSTFTKASYIAPLANNAKGSIYSSRAQIRGVVDVWSDTTVRLRVSEEIKTIALPAAVYLYCAPAYFTDANGKQVSASSVWMNFPDPEQVGTLISSTELPKNITTGKDIAVLANIGDGDTMTAYFVVGYGCQVKKQ